MSLTSGKKIVVVDIDREHHPNFLPDHHVGTLADSIAYAAAEKCHGGLVMTGHLKRVLWKPMMRLNYHLSSRSRQIKLNLFWHLMAPRTGCTVLNLGAAPPHLSQTLLSEDNTDLIEQPEQDPRWASLRVIGADLNRESLREYSRLYEGRGISAVILNGCRLPFRDKSIDIVFSNAVIEHLAPQDQESMANEIMRVAHRWFVTTPNFWYPIELHNKLPLLQFLPRRVQHTIQEKLGTYPVSEPLNLLSSTQLARLLPGSIIRKVRVTFYPETLIAYKAAS